MESKWIGVGSHLEKQELEYKKAIGKHVRKTHKASAYRSPDFIDIEVSEVTWITLFLNMYGLNFSNHF